MRRRKKDVDAFLDAVVAGRRPPRFPVDDEEAREMLTAAALRSGQPGADAPHPEFVENLEQRLRDAMAPEAQPGIRVSRRRLLGGAAAAAAAAVGAGVGIDRLVDNATHGSGAVANRELVPAQGHWVDVAAVEEVPVGRPLRFRAGAIEGYVVNHGEGGMQAVSAMCTHMPCVLVFNAPAQRLDCPCHDAWFGLDGQAIASGYPYKLPSLPTVRTRVLDGRIQVFSA